MKIKKIMSLSLFFLFYYVLYISAIDEKALDIMRKVRDRHDGDNEISQMEMTLIDKGGHKRVRRLMRFSKDFNQDTYRLSFFLYPTDVKDTSFLTYDYDDEAKDDDQWLYLPELKKVKRIASTDKSGSFMGSDLSYGDMTKRDLEDYNFQLKQEMMVDSNKAWLIEAIPRNKKVIDETGYTKSLLIIRQDIYFLIRAVHYVKNGGLLKYIDVKELKEIDGVHVATRTVITKKKGKETVHQTLLNLSDVKFNQTLQDDLFTIRKMEKGL